jgi:hypothetical protein
VRVTGVLHGESEPPEENEPLMQIQNGATEFAGRRLTSADTLAKNHRQLQGTALLGTFPIVIDRQ